jgi:hypothetical protein
MAKFRYQSTLIYLKKAKLWHISKRLCHNTTGFGLWSVTFFFPILRFDEADLFASNLGREPSYIEKIRQG